MQLIIEYVIQICRYDVMHVRYFDIIIQCDDITKQLVHLFYFSRVTWLEFDIHINSNLFACATLFHILRIPILLYNMIFECGCWRMKYFNLDNNTITIFRTCTMNQLGKLICLRSMG